jgi:DNA polymerase I-like protein with 3'-5' exonuclease and polymerase domains
MKVEHSIEVQYQSTNDPETAKEWLNNLPEVFSADFETAVRYDKETIEEAKQKMVDETLPKKERVAYQAIAKSSALGHPSHCTITHCSIAYSEREAYVFIIDAQEIADVVLDFLTDTDRTQVWHNYAYDGRFLRYYQLKDAKNVEDTQIFAKTLVNHVEVFKAATGLKDLAGHWYGDWGISADNFTVEQQYDEHVIKYAAIDACATYKLWEYLNEFIREYKSGV